VIKGDIISFSNLNSYITLIVDVEYLYGHTLAHCIEIKNNNTIWRFQQWMGVDEDNIIWYTSPSSDTQIKTDGVIICRGQK